MGGMALIIFSAIACCLRCMLCSTVLQTGFLTRPIQLPQPFKIKPPSWCLWWQRSRNSRQSFAVCISFSYRQLWSEQIRRESPIRVWWRCLSATPALRIEARGSVQVILSYKGSPKKAWDIRLCLKKQTSKEERNPKGEINNSYVWKWTLFWVGDGIFWCLDHKWAHCPVCPHGISFLLVGPLVLSS